MPYVAPATCGVYKLRRPQASPLFRFVSDHLQRLQPVYDDRFAREYGPWRPVVGQVAEQFLACGVLEHGVARIRCDACTHEDLLAFSCQCRYVCPSCSAQAGGELDPMAEHDIAGIGAAPAGGAHHPQAAPRVLSVPPWSARRDCPRAARTVTAAIRSLTGERDLAVGIVACLQAHGSRANWHPHRHRLVTDDGFRKDGTFVTWPAHDTARVTEAFRHAVLRLFVRRELFDEEQAADMRTWPHSGRR